MVWMLGWVFVPESQACGLFDCFKRKQTPVTAYYPPTTTAPAAPGASCGPATCEQTVLRYVPQVAYRTVWQPVPVTTYRRTVSTNPATGLPITCTQPCTTYTYQARRVPYTTFRPVYATEPVVTAPAATVAPTTIAPAPSSCSNCAAASPAQPYYSSPATTPGYTAPSYTTPSYTAPSYTAPSYTAPSYTAPSADGSATAPQATPWEPVDSGPTAPSGGFEAGGGTGAGSSDPASQRPRISPSIDPNLNRGSSWQQPSGAPAAAAPANSSITSQGFPSSTPAASGTQSRGTDPAMTPWTTVRPEVATPPSFPSSNFNSDPAPSTTGGQWRTDSQQPSPYTVRPLPKVEPEAPRATDPAADVPPLLNDPRDRTAIRPIPAQPIPTRWASNRIEWPERTVGHEAELVPDATGERTQGEAPRRLDPHRIQLKRFTSDAPAPLPASSTGWRSARR
jgi:hypothetical protein